jgi:hypothetical protein
MKRRLRLLIVLVSTIGMVISFGSGSVVASPRDAAREVQLEVGTDGQVFDVGLTVRSDGTGAVAVLDLTIDTVLYECDHFFSNQASFKYSPNKASASADLAGDCWPRSNISERFPVDFTVTVVALDLATEKTRSHTNSAGEQCRVLDYEDDDIHSFAWELDIPEVLDLPDLNIVGTSGNFWSKSSHVCQHQHPDPAQP